PKPRFRRGFLVPDGRRARRTLTGRMFPQPRVAFPGGEERLLDHALGDGFALIRYGADGDASFEGVDQSLWDRLGAKRVSIVPAGGVARRIDDRLVVVDREGTLPRILHDYRGDVLAIRPDRYGLGAFHPKRAAAFALAVEQTIEGSSPSRRRVTDATGASRARAFRSA
ncbi:MAG: hypothetical protein ACREQ9_11585, partial [Candidatus Binatia bacterium]